ncbi:MAG: YicC/YloC family endoribonuclease [Hyphomicrobiaceae bacterium]
MSLNSMTGFGRAEGGDGSAQWVVEARSVNGRGLDVRLRLPPGYDAIETRMREGVTRHFARGSISLALQVQKDSGNGLEIRLNETALAQVLAAAGRVRELTGSLEPTVEGLLAIRGVLEAVEPTMSEAETQLRHEAIQATLETALVRLAEARAAEGQRLAATITAQVDEIERLTALVRESPSRTADRIGERLREQVRRLLDNSAGFDPDRLAQEAAMIATRADIAEELERLSMHVAAARELLSESGPVGRKLDFLTQEFNREANTLCSKSNAADVTRSGLALKAVIDQMREQVQNVE